MHSITFEHRYLPLPVVTSPPSHPLFFPLAQSVSLSFSRSLSLSFPRALSQLSHSNALPARNRRPDSSRSLLLVPSLYTRCTPEARFNDCHASIFSYTNIHLRGPMDTTGTMCHGVYTSFPSSSARHVSRLPPQSFSLCFYLSIYLSISLSRLSVFGVSCFPLAIPLAVA